ncbi:hypothetical protein FA13DRAFT_1738374 [Coprinellus micaceus]|uniref:Uncharacterized protein n=1 Tax=Coprinellus micaceus TaxID=71717 RepID=A0A4Y7SUG5_COPMI|nr:hypothetical protein FA13DRAFT_1738374 [Coprinellus micaceus]
MARRLDLAIVGVVSADLACSWEWAPYALLEVIAEANEVEELGQSIGHGGFLPVAKIATTGAPASASESTSTTATTAEDRFHLRRSVRSAI